LHAKFLDDQDACDTPSETTCCLCDHTHPLLFVLGHWQ